jgi:hypothetical protein
MNQEHLSMKSLPFTRFRIQVDSLFRFKPDRSLIVVAISYVAVVGFLSLATYVATPSHGMYYFLFYAIACAGVAGIATPFLWTKIVEKKPLTSLGITTKRLGLSLLIQSIGVISIQAELVRTI